MPESQRKVREEGAWGSQEGREDALGSELSRRELSRLDSSPVTLAELVSATRCELRVSLPSWVLTSGQCLAQTAQDVVVEAREGG